MNRQPRGCRISAAVFVAVALNEPLGDLMLGLGKHALRGTGFHHPSLVHDDDLVAHVPHQPQIVGDDDIGDAQLLL